MEREDFVVGRVNEMIMLPYESQREKMREKKSPLFRFSPWVLERSVSSVLPARGWLRADEVMTWQCKQLTWPFNSAILLNSQVRFIPSFALTFQNWTFPADLSFEPC
ncbi:AP-3 complex subunit mu-2 [Corchorus olitorius]|uniref:AP-3 complex subunit mu-2 n=1 Tax=Corchorus olitorius TaxID=93759 RepID=A0A1R3HT58_9ROSI|nr:AP-3 complex subunit mu-2 [Corchorus olitorius]